MNPDPTPPWHQPVMVEEAVEFLAPRPGQRLVDCTVGTGGHSLAILPHLMPSGRLLAVDCDAQALLAADKRLTEFSSHVELVHDNFRHLPQLLRRRHLTKVDGVLADLGMSSLHLDQPERGFSFQHEGPLDMRMDPRGTTTAVSLLRRLPESDLAHLLQTYGEERWARRIAKHLVAVRRRTPIETTTQLARLVAEAVPPQAGPRRLHPATRTFQALRMAVNEELASLELLLAALPKVLRSGGRAVIITFHSLEDRLVKQCFRRGEQAGLWKLLMKKPLTPSEREVDENPRSRSAKLRAVEKL
ncbi:MAG: 16S rRNA (cytosine(1402)-N(4))-methyltransferase RsmH [Candidatus Omnitrophica bacterium]|nr:16S rRNA (cytosine(1402)-N(4))-methyltransferase RsmH [Candidatus Omnitrophota bacterium]